MLPLEGEPRPAEKRDRPQGADSTVAVLLPFPLRGPYDYVVPHGLMAAPGDLVAVPLGSRMVAGVVWGPPTGEVERARLKPIAEKLDLPTLPEVLRRFVQWVADYTLSAPGAVLAMCMRAASSERDRARVGYALGGPEPERMTDARRRVLDLLRDSPARTAADLAEEAGVSEGVVRGLVQAGTLVPAALPCRAPFQAPDPNRPGPALSPEQAEAADALRQAAREDSYAAFLLEGVTGSGKTEVYFEAVAEALSRGRQVLVLVPEIALTVQFLERFETRFGARPAEWHSDLSQADRRRTWRAVAEGEARVVVGARSALFLPYPELGLIVVDEEHDSSFKQEDGVLYHARDMAVVRAHLGEIPIVLSSATPSLETVMNARQGRYRRLHLPKRHGAAELPAIAALDVRQAPPARGRWLSPVLIEQAHKTLAAGEQVLFFLNRRGYAPLTLCRTCGFHFGCPNCQTWLVEHRYRRLLQCHHCGFEIPEPEICPQCEKTGTLAACGPGVERLAEEAAATFPDARLAILSSDELSSPAAAREMIGRVARGEVDILIGTQLVAKGHHFPKLTLAGVIDADLGLAGGDLRAAERTWQLLSQVSGRTGRAERPGRVFLQTYMPDHPVIRALVSSDGEAFLAREAEARHIRGLPPFGRLAALIVSGPNGPEVDEVGWALARTAPREPGIEVLGPAPAPLALLRGRRRVRLLVKAGKAVRLQPILRAWLDRVDVRAAIRVAADIDPYSFL